MENGRTPEEVLRLIRKQKRVKTYDIGKISSQGLQSPLLTACDQDKTKHAQL